MENREIFNKQKEIIINRESLPSVLTEIAVEREKKGTSETLIPHIRKIRKEVEKLGDASSVVQLYQEEFLSAQHMVMEEKAKKLEIKPLRTDKGLFIMENTSKEMEKYTKDENLDPVIKARIFRFLGRYMDYNGKSEKSEDFYRKGLEYFDQSTKPEERFNRLELLGFLSFSLIKQGKTEEGINLVHQTLKDFDQSVEGKRLKENDYYAWAVWKSGIEIRTAEHLAKDKNGEYDFLVKEFLTDAENILKMPDGNTEVFRLRLDELQEAKKL